MTKANPNAHTPQSIISLSSEPEVLELLAAAQALSGNGRDTRYGGCWPQRIFVALAQAGTGS